MIGLDGTSWNVLDPLLATGELPNLQALRDEGAHGILESTIPFYTGPAWASFATGSSPAAHGVYDFRMMREGDAITPASAADLRKKTYYEILAEEGVRSVVVNLPLDQGESPDAVIVNSWLTVDDERRIYPLDRRERYAQALGAYQSYPTTFYDSLDTHLEDLCALEESRFALCRELFLHEDWGHFFVLFSSTDWLGHKATGLFLAGDEEARAAFLRLYRQLDGYIGWLREHAGRDPDRALGPRPVRRDAHRPRERFSARARAREARPRTLRRRGCLGRRGGGSGHRPRPDGAQAASLEPARAPSGAADPQSAPARARSQSRDAGAGSRGRSGGLAGVHADDLLVRDLHEGLRRGRARASSRGDPRASPRRRARRVRRDVDAGGALRLVAGPAGSRTPAGGFQRARSGWASGSPPVSC